MKRPFFTLIELLVVIAIIAILAAILLPALNKARARARSIHCCGNMNSFNKAAQLYESDYDNWKPGINSATAYAYQRWIFQLRPYLGLERADNKYYPFKLLCPGATLALQTTDDAYPGCGSITHSYGVNRHGYPDSTSGLFRSVKNSQVRRPSNKLWLADANDWMVSYSRARAPAAYFLWGEVYESTKNNVPCYRHADRINIIYNDGHFGTARWEELWDVASTDDSVFYRQKWDVTAN